MAQDLILRVEASKVDRSGGPVVGLRPQDTYHGRRYNTPSPNDGKAYKSRASYSSTISPLSKAT